MRNMVMKVFILGLMFFIGKSTVLAQDVDIKCEISGLDLNMSGKPGYGIEFGSFSLFADVEKSKEEKGAVEIFKYYKLPRTNVILSVVAGYVPNDDEFGTHLVLSMFLGKKKILLYPDFDNEKIAKDAINFAFAFYPIRAFDKGVKGLLSTAFLGKRKPVFIMMKCKKEDS